MKRFSPNRQQGSTLAVTLIMCITIGTVLGAYLSLIGSRYELTMRSQCWNNAVPVLEAGLEEALTHLRNDAGNLSANGWTNGTVGGQSVYAKQHTFEDGSAYYTVIYNATASNPYIYSTGLIPAPRHPETFISRTVKVTGNNPPLFNLSLGAVYNITLHGNTTAADSFNSSTNTMSTGGQYDPKKATKNGDIASVYGPVDFKNDGINGSLYLGPSVTVTNFDPKNVTGKVYSDYNVSFPGASLPTTVWQTAAKTTVNKTQVYDFTVSGDYQVPDSADVIVEAGVTVRLKVATAASVPKSIHIVASTNGTSGTLSIYQVAGDGSLNNVTIDSGRARNLFYYGLPDVTKVTYNGSTTFIGAIYAPEAALTLNGGGSGNGFIGSAICKSITINGNNFVFHFDEDLLTAGPKRGLVITSWQEL